MQRYLEPVLGMPGYVGGAAAAMLAQRGIGLAGGFNVGTAPLGAVTLVGPSLRVACRPGP